MNSFPAVRSILQKLTGNSSGTNISRHFATMVKTKKFIYAKAFVGEPKETDFKLVEEELPALKDGGNYNLIVYVILTSLRFFLTRFDFEACTNFRLSLIFFSIILMSLSQRPSTTCFVY